MATEPIDSLRDLIKRALRLGGDVYSSGNVQNATTDSLTYIDADGKLAATEITASKPVYTDSNSVPQTGSIPFAIPLAAGATDSGFSTLSISGRATGSANDLMHLNLVKGSNATATIAGYYRVTVADAAGVITDGDYYAPFYTLA